MKKLFNVFMLVTALLLVGSSLMKAQDRPVFIVKGGMNVSNLMLSKTSYYDEPDPKIGYNIGATIDIPAFMKNMFIRTGLGVTSKGAEDGYWDGDFKSNLVYLQAPANVGYRFDFGLKDLALATSGGLYFAYGIAGDTGSENFDISSFDLYKRFDFGFNADVAIEYKRFVGGFLFDIGVLDINKKLLNDRGRKVNVNNVNCSFYVGLKF